MCEDLQALAVWSLPQIPTYAEDGMSEADAAVRHQLRCRMRSRSNERELG